MNIKNNLRKITPNFVLSIIGRYSFVRKTKSFSQKPFRTILKLGRWILFDWFGAEISFTTPDGTRFVSMSHNYSSFVVCFSDYRDPEMQAFMQRHLKEDSVFIDAGANIGTYTVRAAQLIGLKGKVVAIEAHPFIYKYLEKNISLNGFKNVIASNIALGDKGGSVEMSFNPSNAGETHVAVDGEQKISVPLQMLDELLKELHISRVDYIKIDVEGFELPLLMGAQKIIKNNPDLIIQIELEERNSLRYGRTIEKLTTFLFNLGLTPHMADSQGNAWTIQESQLKDFLDVLWWRE